MASNPVKIQNPITQPHFTTTLSSSSSSSSSFASVILPNRHKKPHSLIRIQCSSSSTPPSSREAAILQARSCLSSTLEKPLNNTKLATTKLKRAKQLRFRLEIPVLDDSPESLAQLALELFKGLPIKRKGSPVNVAIVWPDAEYKEAARKVFEALPKCPVQLTDLTSLAEGEIGALSSAEVAVFMAPKASQLAAMKGVSDGFHPRPVVIFNPRWAFEDENEFGEMAPFAGSFEVIYSFIGLEVKGLFSKRNGVVFKCVRDGVVSGEKWSVFVEEDGKLKVISTFKARPAIAEVENVLYNVMAMNSPVTKSVKALKDLVANVTGKKEE